MNSSGGEIYTNDVATVTFFFYLFTIIILALALRKFRSQSVRRREKHKKAKLSTQAESVEDTYRKHKPYRESIALPERPEPTTASQPAKSDAKVRREYLDNVLKLEEKYRVDTMRKQSSLGQEELKYTYVKKEYMMTRSEQQFYLRLFSIIGREYLIFPQIHLSSLFAHDRHRQSYTGALSSIQRKSVDYVLCDTNFRILCAIELDDRTHDKEDRIKRDQIVNRLFDNCGLPLIRVSTRGDYSDRELENIIRKCVTSSLHDFVKIIGSRG